MLIPNQDLDFWNSNLKIHFRTNLGWKSQSCLFCLKIGTTGISRMLILIQTLVFWNSDPKMNFWANLAWTKLEPIPIQKSFLGKFGSKKSNLSVLPENWCAWYLEDADFYFNISFLNFQPKIHFWANSGQKSLSCPFYLTIWTYGISRVLILISAIVFWI